MVVHRTLGFSAAEPDWMAPKPPLKAAALATNKEPASSSKTKTDSARKAAPKAKAEDPKSKEKEKKKVKKANGKDNARESPVLEESTAVEESTAMEEPVAAERCTENERTTESVSARDQANSTPERARRGDASPRTEEKVRRGIASASAETEEPAEPGHHLHLPVLHILRHLRIHLAASSAANKLRRFVALHRLCRAWKRTREIRLKLVGEGKLAVILVANLGAGGSKPTAEVRQKHIHTTVHHAGQRATFLLANEYGWGSVSSGPWSSGGLTLCGVEPHLTTRVPTKHGDLSSCWCYPAQEQVLSPSNFPSIPGVEGKGCFNFIATRQAGAFVLKKMPTDEFYKGLPNEAYDGRFLCAKATQRDPPCHSFLLATWHGQNTHNVKNPDQVAVVKQLCEHLRRWCDENAALCCLFAGDFNIELQPGYDPKEFGEFKRLDPDENVRSQCAGRRRNGNRQNDIDHMLFYPPEVLPLMARRPRRFRMYDRQKFGLLPRRQECRDAGHCSCSEATPPDQACAGAVTHKQKEPALDHDGLILELWLDGTTTSSPR